MTRLLALEWDTRKARVVVASTRGERVLVEQAFSVPLAAIAEKEAATATGVGETIAAALAARKIGKGPALVALGRANIELKQLTLPPSPDDELPDLVRFQAMREFNSLAGDWPLDFVPLSEDPSQPRTVLAAAISPQLHAQIQQICLAAGLSLARLILRPCAAASLLRRRKTEDSQRVQLLVDLLSEEADLTVTVDQRVVYLRTARLSGSSLASEDVIRSLLSEIRRTIGATQNQLKGQRVEAVYLSGSSADHARLAERIKAELQLPVRTFDPFAGFELSADLQASPPDHPGRFLPLLGILSDEAQAAGHDFDFLHPRRRPAPPSKRKPATYAGLAAAAVVLLLGGWYLLESSHLASQIGQLQEASRDLAEQEKKLARPLKTAEAIDEWQAGDVVWLDELGDLSRDFPPAQEAIVTQMNLAASADGGRIRLKGAAQTRATVGKLEGQLRSEHRDVKSGGVREDQQEKKYPQRFDSVLEIKPQDKSLPEGNADRKSFYQEQLTGRRDPQPTLAGPASSEKKGGS